MLHGRGQQNWMTKTTEDDRREALEDRTLFTDSELELLGVSFPQGGGRTNREKFEYWQFPFPINTSVRSREKINLLDLYPIK